MGIAIWALLLALDQHLTPLRPAHWLAGLLREFLLQLDQLALKLFGAADMFQPRLFFVSAAGHLSPCQAELDDAFSSGNPQDPRQMHVGAAAREQW